MAISLWSIEIRCVVSLKEILMVIILILCKDRLSFVRVKFSWQMYTFCIIFSWLLWLTLLCYWCDIVKLIWVTIIWIYPSLICHINFTIAHWFWSDNLHFSASVLLKCKHNILLLSLAIDGHNIILVQRPAQFYYSQI